MSEASIFKQLDYTARFEWGYEGVEQLAPQSDIVVMIDVLSFCTCVDVVCGRGGIVYPYRMLDETAALYAREKGALLAGKRGDPVSLSPACLATIPAGSKLVLPSPNGSTCTVLAQQSVSRGRRRLLAKRSGGSSLHQRAQRNRERDRLRRKMAQRRPASCHRRHAGCRRDPRRIKRLPALLRSANGGRRIPGGQRAACCRPRGKRLWTRACRKRISAGCSDRSRMEPQPDRSAIGKRRRVRCRFFCSRFSAGLFRIKTPFFGNHFS